MYFVQYGPLKEKLSSRSLRDDEALPYLILESVIWTILSLDILSDGLDAFDMATVCLSVIIVIVGFYHVYEQNGGREGYDLVQKYFILGWIVGVRIFIAFIPVFIVCIVVAVNLPSAGGDLLGVFCSPYMKLRIINASEGTSGIREAPQR